MGSLFLVYFFYAGQLGGSSLHGWLANSHSFGSSVAPLLVTEASTVPAHPPLAYQRQVPAPGAGAARPD